MKYIVIQGRMPQDGSKAPEALVMFPKWMSPTLVCAGITGRVIEMTDGSILKQGNVPMSEDEVLTGLLIDEANDLESRGEVAPRKPKLDVVEEPNTCPLCKLQWPEHSVACPNNTSTAQTPVDVAQQRDDAYREGMQAMRTKLAELLLPFGMPADAKVPNWLKEQLEELAQFRANHADATSVLQGQLDQANGNLDAWRGAFGAAGDIEAEFSENGTILRLFVAPNQRVASDAEAIAFLKQQELELRAHIADLEEQRAGQRDYINKLRGRIEKLVKTAKKLLK